jgi:dihydrofolate synthase / folylpolyglutamate synthase
MDRLSSLWAEICTRTDYEKCLKPRAARFSNAPVRGLLQRLGQPQSSYPTLHVAGSKGKGSVARFLAMGLQESGLQVGLYSSPHLSDWRERILVQLAQLEDAAYVRAFEQILAQANGDETFFDLLTAAALQLFQNQSVDVAVIEVGLGGRFDSTRVLEPMAAVVTSIELEHTDVLGQEISEIAWNKAGIFQRGAHLWAGANLPEHALKVLQAEATSQVEPLRFPRPSGRSQIGHPQPHMQANFDLAWSVLRALEGPFPGAAQALYAMPDSALVLPGRWERRRTHDGREVIFDVAHSENSLVAVLRAFRSRYPKQQCGVLFALRDDKNPDSLAEKLIQKLGQRPAQEVWFTAAAGDHPRSCDPQQLAQIFQAEALQSVAFPVGPPVLLVTGSTYLVGALRPLTTPWLDS